MVWAIFMRTMRILKCKQCGVDFSPKNQNWKTKFCSRDCYFEAIRGKRKQIDQRVTEKYKYCLECGKKYYNIASYNKKGVASSYGIKRWGEKIFCSRNCFGAYDGRSRIGMDETKHPKWKGEKVGYYGIHDWVTKHLGQPIGCEVCGLSDSNRKYHWANLSGKYIRDKSDFKRMCVPCHSRYDHKIRKNESAKVLF